jgi:5-deoxy-glucuronate isomerase
VSGASTENEECAFVVLGGKCIANWSGGPKHIGKRVNVFDGFPYAAYVPADREITFTAETVCEIAECRFPSEAKLEPRLITPDDVATSLRRGGNASRQIVDVLRPDFPADKLVVIEAYTPGGNWSSYPPHKHDVHNPPTETKFTTTGSNILKKDSPSKRVLPEFSCREFADLVRNRRSQPRADSDLGFPILV